jgi:aryl-alcohol dehydrogenase-like predicted oxidoreductase
LLHVVQAFKDIRDKVQIATKFSFYEDENGNRSVRGDPEHVREACEGSLQRLGVDCIDLYYQHRLDPSTPIEVTVRISLLNPVSILVLHCSALVETPGMDELLFL